MTITVMVALEVIMAAKLTKTEHNKNQRAQQRKKELREKRKQERRDLAYREHMNTLVASMMIILKMQQWEIKLYYDGTYKPEDHGLDPDTDYAGIIVQDDYVQASIYFTKQTRELFEAGDWRELGRIVLHELCHTFYQPFIDIATELTPHQRTQQHNTNERQTSILAHVILDVIPDIIYTP